MIVFTVKKQLKHIMSGVINKMELIIGVVVIIIVCVVIFSQKDIPSSSDSIEMQMEQLRSRSESRSLEIQQYYEKIESDWKNDKYSQCKLEQLKKLDWQYEVNYITMGGRARYTVEYKGKLLKLFEYGVTYEKGESMDCITFTVYVASIKIDDEIFEDEKVGTKLLEHLEKQRKQNEIRLKYEREKEQQAFKDELYSECKDIKDS